MTEIVQLSRRSFLKLSGATAAAAGLASIGVSTALAGGVTPGTLTYDKIVPTMCEQYVLIPGFADKPLKVPTPSTWKLVDGKWFWYVDAQAVRKTPFGEVKPGTGKVTMPGAAP